MRTETAAFASRFESQIPTVREQVARAASLFGIALGPHPMNSQQHSADPRRIEQLLRIAQMDRRADDRRKAQVAHLKSSAEEERAQLVARLCRK